MPIYLNARYVPKKRPPKIIIKFFRSGENKRVIEKRRGAGVLPDAVRVGHYASPATKGAGIFEHRL